MVKTNQKTLVYRIFYLFFSFYEIMSLNVYTLERRLTVGFLLYNISVVWTKKFLRHPLMLAQCQRTSSQPLCLGRIIDYYFLFCNSQMSIGIMMGWRVTAALSNIILVQWGLWICLNSDKWWWLLTTNRGQHWSWV